MCKEVVASYFRCCCKEEEKVRVFMPYVLFYIFPCVYVAGCCLKDELYNGIDIS